MDGEVSVVIAGGGLVGLSTALFLAGQGVRALLVEKHDGPSPQLRGRGLNLRSMEVLRAAGVEAALRAAPPSVLRDLPEIARAEDLSGPQSFHAVRTAPESVGRLSPTVPLMIDQNAVEPVLREQARRLGAELRFSTRLESFEQDGAGVEVRLRDLARGTWRTVRADYLVAADGHRSGIRDALGIGTSGVGSIAHYVNIPFLADLSGPLRGRRLAVCYLDRPRPNTMLTRLDHPQRWVLMVPYRPGAGERAEDFGVERCVELIRAATGVADLDPELLGLAASAGAGCPAPVQTWELCSRTADRYRAGRVLLTGDAAHVMAPAGGLGGNTGIQDAHNLAWKLAAVLRGAADERLLDTYEQERRPVALAACELSVRQQLSRRSGEPVRSSGPALQPLAAVLGHRYRSAAVVAEEHAGEPPAPSLDLTGEPGSRAPHHPLVRGGVELSTLDLYRDAFVLLCGVEGGRWAAAGRRLAPRLGVRVHRIGEELLDGPGGFAAAHGITDSGAVLVRPDGFVCWRAPDDLVTSPHRTLNTVLARVLGLPDGPALPYQRGISGLSGAR
ncbi:FAD-dependent oxidoreductase [Kitasatospora sp. NPDC101157]|uniref:FAD-dependent oxidoreductase n=1 Tax=Kitasatospora sp. NPDC101157 TaxID=3364098 RepID=UPI00380F634E